MNFWETLNNEIHNFDRLVLLVVVQSRGSSPGRQGFKMAVGPDNYLHASIGGGTLEYKLVEESRDLLKSAHESSTPEFMKFKHSPGAKNESGMICKGDQWIVRYLLMGKELEIIKKVCMAAQNSIPSIMQIDSKRLSLSAYKEDSDRFFFSKTKKNWLYKEQIGVKDSIHIIGAGHVGAALASLMNFLDFRVILYDERQSIIQKIDAKFESHLLDGAYNYLEKTINNSAYNYVAIMTHGHEHDELALTKLLDKKLAYLGMMGSRQKIKKIFSNLKTSGISESQLSHVYAPIGLEINSENPEEIAISIAAQIIAIKNENKESTIE